VRVTDLGPTNAVYLLGRHLGFVCSLTSHFTVPREKAIATFEILCSGGK
jgi:hypothetical protein